MSPLSSLNLLSRTKALNSFLFNYGCESLVGTEMAKVAVKAEVS